MTSLVEAKNTSRATGLDDLVPIPGGVFQMGSCNAGEFERPAHKVRILPFFMQSRAVTNLEFSRFVSATGYQTDAQRRRAAWGYSDGSYQEVEGLNWTAYANGRSNHPVVLVSWNDANAYALWSGQRLPTEAEWEFAARGGLSDATYPWGDEPPDGKRCNFGNTPDELPSTTEVGSFAPNAYGLFDMVGNVWQWCSDWYGPEFYSTSPYLSPRGPESGILKIRRGGAWNVIQPFRLRNANRGAVRPETTAPNIGFRCAKSAERGELK